MGVSGIEGREVPLSICPGMEMGSRTRKKFVGEQRRAMARGEGGTATLGERCVDGPGKNHVR